MYKALFYTHWISVTLFLLIYLIKTVLLLTNNQGLDKISKTIKIPEMIISTLFLVTGVYMLTQIPVIHPFLIIKIIAVVISIPLAIVGFKKNNKALAIISLVLIIAAYGLAEMSKKQSSTPSASTTPEKTDNTVNGGEIFANNCVTCHGADGKLGLVGAPDLTETTMDINTITYLVKQGKGAMTGFEAILNEAQINAVAVYVETLKNN